VRRRVGGLPWSGSGSVLLIHAGVGHHHAAGCAHAGGGHPGAAQPHVCAQSLSPPLAPVCTQVWDVSTLECVRVLEGHSEAVLALAVSPTGHLVSGSYDSTVRFWDLLVGVVRGRQACAALLGTPRHS